MGPTRVRDVLAAAVGVALLCYPLMGELYRRFPPITVWTGLSLAAVAAGEVGWGRHVRAKIADGRIGPGSDRLHPLAVARTVAVGKASAWLGALTLGFWAAVLAYLLPRRASVHVAAQDTGGAVVAALSALALLVAAVWLQHCCKSPPDQNDSAALSGEQPG